MCIACIGGPFYHGFHLLETQIPAQDFFRASRLPSVSHPPVLFQCTRSLSHIHSPVISAISPRHSSLPSRMRLLPFLITVALLGTAIAATTASTATASSYSDADPTYSHIKHVHVINSCHLDIGFAVSLFPRTQRGGRGGRGGGGERVHDTHSHTHTHPPVAHHTAGFLPGDHQPLL